MLDLPSACPHRRFRDDLLRTTCVPGYVYIAQVGNLTKIGFTANVKIHRRMNGITCERGERAIPLIAFKTPCAKGLEKDLHLAFCAKRVISKIDQTDYFRLTDEDIAAIRCLRDYAGKRLESIEPQQCGKGHQSASKRHDICPTKSRRRRLRALILRAECGHELTIPTEYSQLGRFLKTLVFAVAEKNGALCGECKTQVKPVAILGTRAI